MLQIKRSKTLLKNKRNSQLGKMSYRQLHSVWMTSKVVVEHPQINQCPYKVYGTTGTLKHYQHGLFIIQNMREKVYMLLLACPCVPPSCCFFFLCVVAYVSQSSVHPVLFSLLPLLLGYCNLRPICTLKTVK